MTGQAFCWIGITPRSTFRPLLHLSAALWRVGRPVIGPTIRVLHGMGQLVLVALNVFWWS